LHTFTLRFDIAGAPQGLPGIARHMPSTTTGGAAVQNIVKECECNECGLGILS